MTEHLKLKSYLGDGVYAGFDGYQVWIWTSNGVEEGEPIALEGETMRALIKYVANLERAAEEEHEAYKAACR